MSEKRQTLQQMLLGKLDLYMQKYETRFPISHLDNKQLKMDPGFKCMT